MLMVWVLVWLVTAGLIAATQYTSRDPDSKLYAGISARLADEPVRQWIAPEWWGLWGDGATGPFYEHPVGLFLLPAALARLGYPAEQAAYAVNALYQIVGLYLLGLLASTFVTSRDARALQWLLQLLPIAFVFRIRANHEHAVLAALLFALYATERSRQRSSWTAGMVAGFVAVLLIKGAFAFMVPLVCALWLVAREGRIRPTGRPWIAIAVMPVAAVLVVWAYDAAYLRVTGAHFLDLYLTRQMPQDQVTAGASPARFAYNGVWYLSRIVWYAFPWGLLAGVLALRAIWKRDVWPPGDVRLYQGAWFALVTTTVLLVALSLAHRKADRYGLPVYFICAAAGAAAGIRWFPWLQRLVASMDRPWVPPAMYLALCVVRLIGTGPLSHFTFWRT